MTLKIKIKPIDKWIGKETKEPKRSQFSANYAQTKKLLEKELEYIGALESSLQIEMFIRAEDLRSDGELRANAKPYRQGVILSFSKIRRLRNNTTGEVRTETKTLSYPCDSFDDWQDNLRAVALSLEALRKVARYGVFSYEDMVSRLALPTAPNDDVSTRDGALYFISTHSGIEIGKLSRNIEVFKDAYKLAAMRLHPDRGGSHDDFVKLQKAKQTLGM